MSHGPISTRISVGFAYARFFGVRIRSFSVCIHREWHRPTGSAPRSARARRVTSLRVASTELRIGLT